MYLLDTCVFSELIKKDPSPSVIKWVSERSDVLFSVCSLTFGEIKKGIAKAPDPLRKAKLEMWLQDFIVPRFWSRILVIDGSVALTWGELVSLSAKKGKNCTRSRGVASPFFVPVPVPACVPG